MFGKLATLIACVAACGGWLLSLRHERVQAFSELTQAQLRINRQDERLWMLRTQVAERITPPRIEALAAGMVELQPIIPSQVFTPDQLTMMKQGKGTGPELIGPPMSPGMAEASQIAMSGKVMDAATTPRKKSISSTASAAKTAVKGQAKSASAASRASGGPRRVGRRDRNGEEN